MTHHYSAFNNAIYDAHYKIKGIKPMASLRTIALCGEQLGFSAGHFTIFSATERENLHGHNYSLSVTLDTQVESNGLSFDYRFYKRRLKAFCDELNQTFLLPEHSPYLSLEMNDAQCIATFNQQGIPFLCADITVLPLENITVEELSGWFIGRLLDDRAQLNKHRIESITVTVSSSPGQSGSATWRLADE